MRDSNAPLLACEACGSPVQSDESFCSACGAPQSAPQKPPANHATRSSSQGSDAAGLEPALADGSVECSRCGALISGHQVSRSMTCPFCETAIVIELAPGTGRRPEFVVGFAISQNRASELFANWLLKRGWFCPGDLRRRARTEMRQGVYVPFWHFSAVAESRWRAKIGEHWYRMETYTTRDSKGKTVQRTRRIRETEWFPLEGDFSSYKFGHLIPATRGLTEREVASVSPFVLTAVVRYTPEKVAGWPVEEPNVAEADALQKGQAHYRSQQAVAIRRFMPGDSQRDLSSSTNIQVTGTDLVLLPVYIWRYHYRGKAFRFIINGQTGKIYGAKPVSPWRVALAILIPLVLIAGVFLSIQLLG